MDRQRQDRKEARTGNMRLASCGVTCLHSSAVFQFNFSAGLTVLCSEIPHERQAQIRWQKAWKSCINNKFMGYKTVCLDCRKTYNHGTDFDKFHIGNCPECGKLMIEMDQKFKAPKHIDDRKWEIVKFLVNHGFKYQRIYEIKFQTPYVKYPENLRDAKEFVVKYSDQSIK